MVGHGRNATAGLVGAEMKSQTQTPIWIVLGITFLWIGLAANIAFEYFSQGKISPFSILFLIALVAGLVIPKIFNWPLYTRQPSRPAIISIVLLLAVLAIYMAVRFFVL